MAGRKQIRTRGKFSLQRFFQRFVEGDHVDVVRERRLESNFPRRLQGRTGIVEGMRGRACIVRIKDQTMPKQYIIQPVHLKKIKQIEKTE
jgi:ribosomal protein L21E